MNKSEQAFQAAVRELGCIICLFEGKGVTPAEIHHMLSGGRRIGEMSVLGLCYWHHRSKRNDAEVVSRDQNQRRFEARYGTEKYLLEETRKLCAALQK